MPQPGENGGGVAIRREIPLRTKKPRSGFRARTGLCSKIPKMAPKNREIRNTPAVPELRSAQSEDTMVNKVRVNIAGAPYAIATTDSETYITSLAKKLDEDIAKLLDGNENLSVTKAAVFCAMDYLDEYKKSTGSAENMRGQIQDYIADAARAKLAEDKAKAENEVLRREAAALREQLAKERQRETRREERAARAAAETAQEQPAPEAPAADSAQADETN